MLVAKAAMESDDLSRRLRRAFDQRAVEGRPHGSRAFGYDSNGMTVRESDASAHGAADRGTATVPQARSRAATRNRPGLGYSHIHTAIDAYSRLAYSEFAGTETADNCVAFLSRAVAWFAAQGITIERILTDNGPGYRSIAWARRCARLAIRHTRTRPYRPATNGKAERFNRTLADEWAYARLWTSVARRARTLDRWLHRYNSHRHHTAIGAPPASRVTNLAGQNI